MPSRFFSNHLPDFHPGAADPYHCDRCLAKIRAIVTVVDRSPSQAHPLDGGLYIGPAGVAYAYWYLASKGIDESDLLEKARDRLSANLAYATNRQSRRDSEKVGFLIGHSGVYALAALLAPDERQRDLFLNHFAAVAPLAEAGVARSDELLVGRAGFVCGALWLSKSLGRQVIPLDSILKICDKLLASGREYSRRRRSPCPLMYEYYGTEYLGAAHGLCSILQMLLSVPDFVPNRDPEYLIRQSLDFLLSLQSANGNFPCAMDEVPGIGRARRAEDELVHWCHGAPGTVYLMARAYIVFKERKYLESARACGECVWRLGLLKKGPGICHGVAGSGYVFLLLYRLVEDEAEKSRWLHRAKMLAQFMESPDFARGARTPDCPYSLYEGLAGTACFLADLRDPERAAFPFFDVFDP